MSFLETRNKACPDYRGGKKQEARAKKQEARAKKQEARAKKQELRSEMRDLCVKRCSGQLAVWDSF
jgi:hypothetical protein